MSVELNICVQLPEFTADAEMIYMTMGNKTMFYIMQIKSVFLDALNWLNMKSCINQYQSIVTFGVNHVNAAIHIA